MSNARQLAANLPREGGLSNRNLIINGAMQVWQRGTSSSVNGYLADRWEASNITTASRQTDAPDEFQHSIEVGNSSPSYPLIIQRIEAANVQHLSGQSITISFWAKSISGTANLFAEYLTPSTTDNFSSVTIRGIYTWATPSTSWVKYTYTITSVNAEVLNGLEVRVGLQNQSAGTVRITGVQLEVGDTATPFEHRSYGDELARCQRYTYRINGHSVDQKQVGSGYFYSSTQMRIMVNFPVTMRAEPSVSSNSLDALFDTSNDAAVSISSSLDEGTTTYGLNVGSISTSSIGNGGILRLHNVASSYIEFDAEL